MGHEEAYQAERAQLLRGFADNVRRLRKEKEPDYSQEELAGDAKLHRTEIGRIEQAKCEPGVGTLIILADTLGCTLNDLVEGIPVPQERRPSPQAKRKAEYRQAKR